MKIRCHTFAAVAIFAMMTTASAAAETKGKTHSIGMYFTSSGGQSASAVYDFANAISQVAEKEFNLKIELKKYASLDEVKDALIAGKVDGGLLWPTQIVELKAAGVDFYPASTYVIGKKRKSAYCLWHRKSDATATPNEIIGKTLLASDYSLLNLIQLRQYFFDKGIDKPLWSIFSKFKRTPNANSAYMAIAMGEADFFWTNDDGDSFLKLINSAVASKLAHRFCTDNVYSRGNLVMIKKEFEKEKFYELMTSMMKIASNFKPYEKKYPTIKALISYQKLAKMNFIPSDPNEIDVEVGLFQKAKKNGWLEESEYIIKTWKEQPIGQAISIRPDFKYCKTTCDKSKEKLGCIDKCMK